MTDYNNDNDEILTFCDRTFAMLDKWLVQIGSENDGVNASEIVQRAFHNNIEANISHYQFMVRAAMENQDQETADRNRLMVNLYKGFLT